MCSAGRFEDALLLVEQWTEEQRQRERDGGEELERGSDTAGDGSAGLSAPQVDHVRVR